MSDYYDKRMPFIEMAEDGSGWYAFITPPQGCPIDFADSLGTFPTITEAAKALLRAMARQFIREAVQTDDATKKFEEEVKEARKRWRDAHSFRLMVTDGDARPNPVLEVREALGASQKDMAGFLGCRKSQVKHWEEYATLPNERAVVERLKQLAKEVNAATDILS